MKAKNKIIKIRKQNPLVTGSEIARKVGVCRQYVSRILKEKGLNNIQPNYKKKVVLCVVCDRTTPRGTRLCPNGDCKDLYYNIEVTCAFCKYDFKIQRSHIIQRYNRGMRHIYCSKPCYARGQKDGLSSGHKVQSGFRFVRN